MAFSIKSANSCNNVIINVGSVTGATSGTITLTSISSNGGSISTPVNFSGVVTTVVLNIDDLPVSSGVYKIDVEENGSDVYSKALLINCDIDCCLTKLTNELIDCACDCPKCASSLAKAQKIMLLLKSAEYALIQADNAELGNQEGFIKDADSKYKKAFELCDASCGCDC